MNLFGIWFILYFLKLSYGLRWSLSIQLLIIVSGSVNSCFSGVLNKTVTVLVSLIESLSLLSHFKRSFRCVQIVRVWSYSGPPFPVFGLNTERRRENTDQSNCEYGDLLRSVQFVINYRFTGTAEQYRPQNYVLFILREHLPSL